MRRGPSRERIGRTHAAPSASLPRETGGRHAASPAGAMARAYRAEARLDLTMGCPPVINAEEETDLVRRCCVDELGEAAAVGVSNLAGG